LILLNKRNKKTKSSQQLFCNQSGAKGMKLKIVLEQGTDGYIVAHCPALRGCVTQGHTEEEALKNIREAIELYLEADPQDLQLTAGQYKVCELAV
jgi:predicted RNase H-like HicB family nuclease